jgi:2-oxoglutarate dehydrogenase E1 component
MSQFLTAKMQALLAYLAVEAAAVMHICERLDGLPLALELAAARIKLLSVDEIATRLAGRCALLWAQNVTPRPGGTRMTCDRCTWSSSRLPCRDLVDTTLFLNLCYDVLHIFSGSRRPSNAFGGIVMASSTLPDTDQGDLFDFHGPNAGYVLDLFERYQADPNAVDPATRAYFARWQPRPEGAPPPENGANAAPPREQERPAVAPVGPGFDPQKVASVANLAQAIREYGHLAAHLDPLGSPPPGDPALELAYHGLTEADLHELPASIVGGPLAYDAASAFRGIEALRAVYSATIGHDYDHLRISDERTWLRYAAESGRFRPPQAPIDAVALLERLTQVEAFEQFLQRAFPGKTRFSIEGLDMMVPMLDAIVANCVDAGIYKLLIGMAHRGRLNVLAHVLQKPYRQILLEFKDPAITDFYNEVSVLGYTGDVKYHAGADRSLRGEKTAVDLHMRMVPNPSHLEHVNPVVAGMARAAGTLTDERGPGRIDPSRTVPILIHGDAAFPGQGIVAETLNLARVNGYTCGGTIHIIANNQIGFTADPEDARSTLYASDLAKGFKLPIVHVNADDPLACIEAARMAVAYCNEFEKDFLIDLIGYRRYGHNEGDEPRFTQPKMYSIIDNHPTVRRQLADHLVAEGEIEANQPDEMVQRQLNELQTTLNSLGPDEKLPLEIKPPPPGAARKVHTAVPAETLRDLHRSLMQTPEGFRVHPRLQRIRQRMATALDAYDEPTIDWTTAEQLALASVLAQGIPVRLTGEDVLRGTFSHRHAVLFDPNTGAPYVPLHNIPQARAAFQIFNSPLSEAAAIGFEYGYNIERPDHLVIWEAQYGDFINVGQAIVDEFVVSGFAKWDQTPSLVLLLPHGYEGQGPDHASGRLERFLQLAAEVNMRIANPTTAAQYFHLLRRQALLLNTDPLPLIVMSPKSLLRQPLSLSPLRDLVESRWRPVIDDAEAAQRLETIRRLILCSGKIYVDLMISEARKAADWMAIARVEQLYPFPADHIDEVLKRYPNLEEVLWVQEEPRNMGAWSAVKPQIQYIFNVSNHKLKLRYVGRPRRASPAEGSVAWHQINQAKIVQKAFEGVS